MTHGPSRSHDWPSLLGLVCIMAIAVVSCAPGRTPRAAGVGSAGAGGSGGIWDNGGGPGSGGDPIPVAGGDSGSSGSGEGGGGSGAGGDGTGGGGQGGATGAGGTTVAPNGPCMSDSDCAANGQACEPKTKLCVECVKSGDCPSGGHCFGNRCVTFTACSAKSDCSSDPICDTTRGVCVECVAATDCPGGQSCTANKCVALSKCKINADCPSNVCDTANNVCLDCLVDSHCGSAGKRCVRNVCRTACTSKADCSSLGMVCDTSNSACVQCLTVADCPSSWYCLVNACVPDVCDSTQSACSGTSVAGCNPDGDRFDNFTSCGTGKPCVARGAVAGCGSVPTPGRDAGTTDTRIPSGDAGGGSCGAGTTAEPCKSGIPKFSGTQTLDGRGTELCALPSFVLGAQNAAKVLTYNNAPTSQFETATARVAWDSAGLHAFVEVQDSSVQTVYMADPAQAIAKVFQGDSVEMFFSSSNNVTGLTSSDSNTIHLVVPATGPAASVKDTGSSGTSAALPTNQYVQASTSAGYAVEVLVPWPGGAPSSGTTIRFDMVINSADKKFSGVDDMRDGQMIYYIGSIGGTTSCQGSDGAVPWCDDRTWCQASLQ